MENEEYFPYIVGDKIVQLTNNGWTFDKKGLPRINCKFVEITAIGRNYYLFTDGFNERICTKITSYNITNYDPMAESIKDYFK